MAVWGTSHRSTRIVGIAGAAVLTAGLTAAATLPGRAATLEATRVVAMFAVPPTPLAAADRERTQPRPPVAAPAARPASTAPRPAGAAAPARAAAPKATPRAPAPKTAAPKTAAPKPPTPKAAPVKAAAPKAAPVKAAAAPASSLCAGDGWQKRRGEAARADLRHAGGTRSVPVSFQAGRNDVLGMADLDRRSVTVYVRSCSQMSDSLLRHVIAHELGHILDEVRMSSSSRAEWMQVRGIDPSTPWYGCSRCADFATPAGDFAEVYAQWATGSSSNRSQLSGDPGRGELASLASRFFGA